MNNQLFSTIVTSLTNLNDAQGAQILSIVNGLQNVATPSATVVVEPKKVSTKKEKKEFNGTAKDVTVDMKATKAVVTVNGWQLKDVWEVLKRRYEALGGTYDKTSKSIIFKTQKDAKEFATNTLVSASERENIWKEWKEKAR